MKGEKSHFESTPTGNMGLFPSAAVVMQRAEYNWIHAADGPNENVNQLMALARKLLGTPKNLQLIDGDTDLYGDGSVTLLATPGTRPVTSRCWCISRIRVSSSYLAMSFICKRISRRT
jgi:hypothetical protein